MFNSGILFILAGPSGAGKTTLAHYLINKYENTFFSVSTTTRARRGNEIDGKDYFFVDEIEFDSRVENSLFLEWATVHGNKYGTEIAWVRNQLASGSSVVLDVDVQGAVQIKEQIPSSVLIFVLPGSKDILRSRLEARNTDSRQIVASRMQVAAWEVSYMGMFDYFVCNDKLETAKAEIESIYLAEKMKLRNIGWPSQAIPFHKDYFSGTDYWLGKKVVVASGPTREMIDDVRFISNRSSGLMGVSLAEVFLACGAEVTLVSGPACIASPPGPVKLVKTYTAKDMLMALQNEMSSTHTDLLVMAAAVADYQPVSTYSGKLKRTDKELHISLVATPDITVQLKATCPVLSFALEFGETALSRAKEKLVRKGAYAIFLNRGDNPGEGMESVTNAGSLIFALNNEQVQIQAGSKKFVALGIIAALGRRLSGA